VLRIRKLLWNDANENHLRASHGVLPSEVDEIVFGIDGEDPDYIVNRDGDNYVIYGRTGAGRLLYIALEPKGGGLFRPFAARNMTLKESNTFRKGKR
jgi:uncharacterized DUF497 family protein